MSSIRLLDSECNSRENCGNHKSWLMSGHKRGAVTAACRQGDGQRQAEWQQLTLTRQNWCLQHGGGSALVHVVVPQWPASEAAFVPKNILSMKSCTTFWRLEKRKMLLRPLVFENITAGEGERQAPPPSDQDRKCAPWPRLLGASIAQ